MTLKPTRDAGASARPQAQILSPSLLRDSRLRSGQPRSGSGSAEWSADITSDGSWYIGGIEFEDVERLENYRLVSTAPSTSRVIAEGINLGPGDDLTIEDPWVHAPPVDLAFVLDDGRPAANLGRAEILRPDAEPVQETPTWTRSRSLNAVPARALAVTTAEIGADGRLKIDHLPRGSWRWRLTGRGLREPVEALFEHNGLDSEPVRLAGYSSLSGTLTEYQEFGSSALHWQSSIRWTLAADPVEPSNRGGSRGVVNVDHGGHFKLPLVPMGKELVIRPLQSFTGSRTRRLGPGSLPQWAELRLTVGAAEQEDVTLLRIR